MKSLKLPLLLATAFLPLLSACGDDDSGSSPRTPDNREIHEGYTSLEELPECTSEIAGDIYKVKETYYTCFAKSWEPVEGFVAGICNIRACTENNEGDLFYVESGNEAFQCKSGTWRNASGQTFSDSEFVDCYIAGLATADVKSLDSLKGCTKKREGDLAFVDKKLYACNSESWEKLQSAVISEDNLGECSDKKSVYVLSKMALYTCKDGAWRNPSQATEITSSSSSSEQKDKPVESSSSSSEQAIEEIVDDGTKVRGVCIVSEKNAVRGTEITYSFYNMGGTPISYSWSFGEKASIATSNAVSPKVSYSRGGAFRAELVVNEGRASQSDVIVCSKVDVSGIPVTDCQCNTKTDSMQVSIIHPDSAIWTVSGCKGGESFSYEWDGSTKYTWTESSDGMSTTGIATEAGNMSPVLTVTNDENESMTIVCPNVLVMGIVSATCTMDPRYDENEVISEYIFRVRNISDAGSLTSLSMTLSRDDGYSKAVSASVSSPIYWNWESFSYAVPQSTTPGIHTYRLTYGDYEICSVTPVNCGPSESTVYRNDSVTWGLKDVGDYTAESYLWRFVDAYGYVTTSTEAIPKIAFENSGLVSANVTIDAGLNSEQRISCADLQVTDRPITGCTCEASLISESDDVDEQEEVVFGWNVTGCESEGAEPLSYSWPSDYEATDGTATRTFTVAGRYTPRVLVENQDGTSLTVKCASAVVKGTATSGNTMTDPRDGQVYRIVEIGDQTWMAENLNYDTTGAVCFNNSLDSCDIYGSLYPFKLAYRVCPEGWHLPYRTEFNELLNTVGGFDNLRSSEWDGDDPYGFSALPAGKYDDIAGGEFTTWQFTTGWWLQSGELYAVSDYGPDFTADNTTNGFSVRCVMD